MNISTARLFSILFLSVSAATVAKGMESDAIARANQLKQKAITISPQQPDTAIALMEQAATLFESANDKRDVALCLQQTAYIQDEYKREPFKGTAAAKEAIVIWKDLRDTTALASTYRYLARLQGKLYDMQHARKNIDTAIQLYTAQKDKDALAFSYAAMSIMYEQEQKVDSAIHALQQAQDLWKQGPDVQQRTFITNSNMLRLNVMNNRLPEAEKLIKTNAKHAGDKKLTDTDKLSYYYYCWVYYQKTGDQKSADKYKGLYDAMKESAQKQPAK